MGVQERYLNNKAQKATGKTVKLGVKERYEQRQQEAEQATGVQERYEQRQRYIAMGAEQVDQDFLNRFSSDAGDFLNRAGSRELSYADAGTALEQLENQWTAIQGWIGLNGIDVDLKENADFKQALDSIRGGLDSARDYYGQWETEDAYNTYWKQKDELDALLSLDLENYAQQIETLRQERQTQVDTTFDWTDNQQRDAYDEKLQEYDLDIAAMEQRLQQAQQIQEAAYYDNLPEQADFSQRGSAGWERYLASRDAEEPEESWLQWLGKTLGKTTDTSLPNAQFAQAQNAYAEDTSYIEPGKDWTEQQKQTFGYLYETDPENAQRYARYANEQNHQAQNAEKIAAIQEWAIKNGWNSAAATLASIAMMPLSLADTLDALAEYSARGTLTTKAVPMPGQVSAAINSAVSSELNEKYGTISEKVPVLGGKGLGDAYQLAVSIANSMLVGNTQGTLGTYVTFFGSAASSEMMAAKEAGATDQQAILRGVLSGLAEAAGEAFSVENLLDAGQLKNFWLDVLKQAGIEASEEGMTTLLNNFAEQIVMGHQSSFYKQVNQYRAEGLSTEEAKRKAWGNMTEDLIFDMMGGALSGGISSGIQMGINDAADAKYYEEVYGGEAMALVKEALELDPGNTYALWMQKKLETGNALSGGELRELVQQNEEAMHKPGKEIPIASEAEEDEIITPEETVLVEKKADQSGTQTATMEVAEEANTRSVMNSDQETAGGREIPQAAQEDITHALVEASKKYGVRGEAMRRTYLDGQNVAEYARAFDIAYNMGRSGVSLDYTVKSEAVSYLTQSQRELAHGIGRSAANGKTQWRKGTVKGEGVSIDDLKATFNDPQGRAYRYLAAVAEVTGIDIVLYRSHPGEDGSFTGEQGRYDRRDPGKVYIDLNAGLVRASNAEDLGKYTMLRTFAHEFTHFIEYWNSEQYNELHSVVLNTMAQKGEDIHDLIELRMAQEDISYDAASREVVAEALTDILPDSSFVQELAEKHQTIFQKLLEKLKDFLEDMREAFRRMHPNSSREAQALKTQAGEQVRYLEGIVEAFDRAAVQAVENYQLAVAGDSEMVSGQDNAENTVEEMEADTGTEETVHAEVSAEEENLPQAENTTEEVPAKEETENAKQELRKAVRMPIQGTNAEALLAGIRNRELSMASITMGGTMEGFNEEQRRHLVEKLLEGVYTDKESIRIDVPYDGKFEIVNTPGNVAKVLENLKVKAVQEALFSKQTIGLLTAKGDIRITSLDGETYLSNTALMIRASDAAVEYVRKEYPTKENPIHPEIEKTMGNIRTPVTTAPMEGKLDKTPVLIFQEDGKQFVFDKRYFAPLDGCTLYYSPFNGSAILKAVDSNGEAFGYLMGLKPGAAAKITDIKPSKLRSFAKKKTSQSQAVKEEKREQTAPKAEEAAPKAESVQKKKPAPKKERQEKPKTVETSEKLEDFGEKIGGARKDQWSKRGLLSGDLEVMNERERANHVKKDNVWKRPDYRKLIEGGQDRNLLFARNEIRKALNQNVVYPYGVEEERKKQIQVEFVETVRIIQAMAEQVTTKDALMAMGRPWLIEQGYRTDRGFTDKWRKNPALQGSNYVQTIEYLARNWDQLDKLADKANFAVDAEQKIPAGYSIHEDDKDHTWFIARGSWVIMSGIPSYQEAMDILRGAAAGKKKKTRFVPQQLLEVHRKGPDYRGGRDVNGQDYLDTFGFKGGEFGNWMNEKDRRVSMNYGFDALKDLADALGIQDRDISLDGNLSIAFGARGQGLSGAAAHYESERRVINLTKMNGAGSLAHEWFHALDDFLGEYGSHFATEQHRKLPEATREAIRNLLTTMQYRDATQEETDLAATKAYEQAQRSVTYQVSNQFGWVQKLEKGSLTDADTRYFARKPTQADAQKYHDLLNQLLETGDPALVDALSALRKEVNGRVIPKEDREAIGYRLYALKPSKTKQVQKMRLRSDFYENSRKFGQLHHKDGDYWDSTIEMAARAFACYVAYKTGKRNDYLSAHSDTAVTLTADKDGKPVVVRAFPVGAERTAINGAFDQLFEALKADGFLHPAEEAEKPGMVQYQSRKRLSEDATVFRRDLDNWDKTGRPEGRTFVLGSTGEVLQGLGAIESDVYMQGDKINKIFEDHPEMNLKEIRNIPEILENPVMVLASRNINRSTRANTRLTVFGMVKAQNGLPVMVAFDLLPKENGLYLADMQKVVSAYTKDRTPTATLNLMQNSEVLYADKEKTAALLRSIGFQMPTDLLRNGYIGSISYSGTDVNIKGTPFLTILKGQSEQHQQRSEALSDREILLAASEELMAGELTSGEADALAIIQRRLNKLEELQSQRAAEGKLYRQQQFTPGADRAEAQKTLNRMKILESQIQRAENEVLSAEDKQVLKRVLQKAREIVQKQQWTKDQETLKRWRNRRNDAAAIKKYRERLQKDVGELTDWVLHPNNKNVVKHIPDALKRTVLPFLNSIDFTSKQQLKGGAATKADEKMLERMKALKSIAQPASTEELYADYTDLPPNFLERLEKNIEAVEALVKGHPGEMVVNQMTSQELRELSQLVRTLKEYIQNFNKFHANAMFQHVHEAGDSTIGALEQMRDASKNAGEISNFLLWQQMRPAYAFERFGQGGKAIYDGLRRGQAKLAFHTRKIQEFSEQAYTAEEVKDWEKELLTVELEDGTVTMPVATAMSFYELTKRPQALGHILGQGIRVATFRRGSKKMADSGHTVTVEDVQAICDALTSRQKEVADSLQKYMQEQGGKWGNEVSLKRFGEQLFGEEHYFPINSDGRFLAANAEEHPANASLYALLNMGFTKAVTKEANNRIVLYSIFDVFANHMASMAQYNALALPVVDALKWFNYQQKSEPDADGKRKVTGSVRDQMDRVYGVPEEKRPGSGKQGYAQTFVINILKAFNGTEAQGVPTDAMGINALHRYNVAQVAYNMRVVVQQPLAIARAALLIDYQSIMKGMLMLPDTIRENIRQMQKYSGIAAWKSLGFYDVNISRGLTSIIKHDANWVDQVNEFGMRGAEKADRWAWAAMWNACKMEVKAKRNLKPEDPAFFEAVTELFEEVVYKTQVVDSVLTKNEYLRSKGLFARLMGSFMSEPTTTASMLVDAFDKYSADMQRGLTRQQAWKKNGANIARTAYVYGVSALILAAVQAAADALRDDDDYQNYGEKWAEAFGGNLIDELMPFNKLPILSDFYELAKELLSVLGVDTYGNPPQSVFMQWYDTLVKGVEILYGRIKGTEDRYTWYGGAYKLLQALSGMTGLPMAAATREIIVAWNHTVGAMAPSLKAKTYDPGDKNSMKYAFQDGYLTEPEATALLLRKGLVEDEDEAYWTIRGWEAGEGYSRYDRIYEAVLTGEGFADALRELVTHGYTVDQVEGQIQSQVRKWYTDEDSEIRITREQAEQMLADFCDKNEDVVAELVTKWSCVVETGIAYEAIGTEYVAGSITAEQAVDMYIRYGGYEPEDAADKVKKLRAELETGIAFDEIEEAYLDGEISAQDARDMLVAYGSYTKEEAENTVKLFQWHAEGYNVNIAAVKDYETFCAPVGVEKGVYYDTYRFYLDSGEEGVSYSKVKECMPYIDGLPLTAEQKTALALCWWSESTVRKYKLW